MNAINSPGLCPDPMPDDIQDELTQLRARVKELEASRSLVAMDQLIRITEQNLELTARIRELEDEAKRGMAWADRVEKLRLETANNLTKSIENNNEQEVTIELLRLTVNQLRARVKELESDSITHLGIIGEKESRIRELEEAMPEAGALRGTADLLKAHRHQRVAGLLEDMADRIEAVMRKEGNE